jgi:hypothetical protein
VGKLIGFEKGLEEFTGESVIGNFLVKLYYKITESPLNYIICGMKYFKDSEIGSGF